MYPNIIKVHHPKPSGMHSKNMVECAVRLVMLYLFLVSVVFHIVFRYLSLLLLFVIAVVCFCFCFCVCFCLLDCKHKFFFFFFVISCNLIKAIKLAPKLRTRNFFSVTGAREEEVNLHPSSVLSEQMHFDQPFLVYHEKGQRCTTTHPDIIEHDNALQLS